MRDNKKYGKLSANKVLRDFISWNKEAIDNRFSYFYFNIVKDMYI